MKVVKSKLYKSVFYHICIIILFLDNLSQSYDGRGSGP